MPTKINLTKEQTKEMIRLRVEEKRTYSQIAKTIGVSPQTVTRRLSEILGSDLYNISTRYQYDRFFFYEIDTKEKAYWLGFITADGYVNEDRNFLQIHLQWSDRLHLEKFLRAIRAEDRIKVKKEYHSITGKPIATVFLSGKEMIECLVKQGVCQNKSNNEKPPKNIPDNLLPDYIRGLWDGDGHISRKKIDLRSSHEMCTWVQKILIDKCNISKTTISFESGIYRFFCCKNRNNVLKYLYYTNVSKEICLDRKYKEAKILMLRNLKSSHSRSETKTA